MAVSIINNPATGRQTYVKNLKLHHRDTESQKNLRRLDLAEPGDPADPLAAATLSNESRYFFVIVLLSINTRIPFSASAWPH